MNSELKLLRKGDKMRRVNRFPNYKASRRGFLYKKINGKWKRIPGCPHVISGHILVRLRSPDGNVAQRYLHQIILETFVGPCPPGKECRHFPDDDPSNNDITNLSWGTRKQNQKDRIVHGTSNRGERNGHAKLTERKVKKIRKLHKAGWSQYQLGRRFKVTRATIAEITRREIWRHVP